jgi:Uri superfamily endonuclease
MDFEQVQAGVYVLIQYLSATKRIGIGKLGVFEFTAGYYAYVGSAFGPGGLASRLKHHRRRCRRPHWHIDHLRRHTRITQIWLGTERRLEHEWTAILRRMKGAGIPAPGFGSSDCGCDAHLVRFDLSPSVERFNRAVQRAAGHAATAVASFVC